jgi:HEAT repeat protein
VPLLEDLDPAVRFWAATLLGLCPEHGRAELVRHARDPEANVRAAVMEALGERGDRSAAPVVRALLGDAEWFVRLHACRSLGRLGETADAARVAPLLRDRNWWVRAAAKDALRGLGLPAVGALLPYLEDADAFARNGAAEVLQDIGLVDTIAAHGAGRDLLERILAAGGEGYRAAALVRADLAGHEERAQAG